MKSALCASAYFDYLKDITILKPLCLKHQQVYISTFVTTLGNLCMFTFLTFIKYKNM